MKVGLKIEYSADRDTPGETEQDEQRTLDVIEGLMDDIVTQVREACEAQGLTVNVRRG